MNRGNSNDFDPRGLGLPGIEGGQRAGVDPAGSRDTESQLRLRQEHANLLRMYEAFDREHDRNRQRLLTALPAGAPASCAPSRRRRIGDFLMRHILTRTAAIVLAPAACILVALALIFSHGQSNAFAQAVARLREARTIVAHFEAFMNQAETPLQKGTLYLSDEHGMRFDANMSMPIAGATSEVMGMSIYQRPGGPCLLLQPALKFGVRLQMPGQSAVQNTDWDGVSPDKFLAQFRRMSDKADAALGRSTIDGREVEGFEVSAKALGLGFSGAQPKASRGADEPPARARLWVDVQTHLPVRMEVEVVSDTGIMGRVQVRAVYSHFQFDTPLDAAIFEPKIPDGMLIADLEMPAPSEETLLATLRMFRDLTDHYPASLDPAAVAAELAITMVSSGAAVRDDDLASTIKSGFLQKALNVAMGCAYVQQLARDGHEPEYFGADVTPEDKDEVLATWRLDDGSTRVIYGDLRVETRAGESIIAP